MNLTAEMIDEASHKGRQMLNDSLKAGTAVLMAGAGCSVSADYPSWPQLITMLAQDMCRGISLTKSSQSGQLQEIWDECCRRYGDNGERISRFIGNCFRSKSHAVKEFHRNLVRLPLAGFTTTNYDHVIEDAIRSVGAKRGISCETINLCDNDHRIKVLECFRDHGAKMRDRNLVLHLHGSFDRPRDIVLTERDYRRFYDEQLYDAEGKPTGLPVKTSFHRKVIWSLVATRMLVFVGFSLSDDDFDNVLETLRFDVNWLTELFHVAIMPCFTEEDMIGTSSRLNSRGVAPVFYQAFRNPENGAENHSQLNDLIQSLAGTFGIVDERVESIDDVIDRAGRL